MDKPLCIDLFCGLGGWSEGFLYEGWKCVGFDIERHDYGCGGYPGQLVIQNVLTIDGKQFKSADCIVASPPCQTYSYMAMPWSKAKAIAAEYRNGERDVKKLTALFDACFRIQSEASEAAGRHIPMIVENVRGAQPWVGRSRWNFGSYHLWGDVPALMPMTNRVMKNDGGSWFGVDPRGNPIEPNNARDECKVPGFRFDGNGGSFQSASVEHTGHKSQGMNWSDRSIHGQDFTRIAAGQKTSGLAQNRDGHGHTRHLTNQHEHDLAGVKGFTPNGEPLGKNELGKHGSKSKTRKAASAAIAKIPFALSRYIAAHFKP